MKVDLVQLHFIDRRLRVIAVQLEDSVGVEFTLTSLYRINDNGVHGTLPLRAMDLSIRNNDIGLVAERFVNGRWIYDPTRPKLKCALLHDAGSGLHLHLQTHLNTVHR